MHKGGLTESKFLASSSVIVHAFISPWMALSSGISKPEPVLEVVSDISLCDLQHENQ